jgi:hypothetical protein
MALGLGALGGCSLVYPLDDYDRSTRAGDAGEGGRGPSVAPHPGTEGDGATSDGATPGVPGTDSLLAYGTRSGTIKLRRWNPGTQRWSAAAEGPKLPANQPIFRVRARRVDLTHTLLAVRNAATDYTGGAVSAFETDGTTTKPVFEARSIPPGPEQRSFDIATLGAEGSGRAIAVYASTGGNLKLRLRAASGTWGDEQAIFTTPPSTADISWVELVSRPGSEDLALLWVNFSGDLWGTKWNGTAFGAAKRIVDLVDHAPFKSFAGAFESRSGDLLIAWAEGGTVRYLSSPAGDAVIVTTASQSLPLSETAVVALAPHPANDRIALSTLEFVCGGGTCDDFTTVIWNGNTFDPHTTIDADIGTSFATREGTAPIALGWLGDVVIAPYHREAPGFRWARFANSWALQPDVPATPPIADKASFVLFRAGPGSMINVIGDVAGRLWAKKFDGTGWSATEDGMALADDLPAEGVLGGLPFDVDTR